MEQRNSVQFIILTIVISIAMIAIAFGVSTAVNAVSSKSEASYFGDQTFIGPVKVDGLSREQAALILTQETESWKSEQNTVIQLILEKVKLDTALIEFDIETSVNQAESGKRNPLLQSIDEHGINQVLDGMALSNNEELNLQLKAEIQEHAKHLMELPKTIHLTNYFTETTDETMIFASHTMSNQLGDMSATNWVRKNQEIIIKEGSIFSLNELFMNQPHGLYSVVFQNELASTLYKSALNAPFSIVERHITTDNRYDQEIGYEAFIDAQHDIKFKNEYGKPIKIISSLVDGVLTIIVEGAMTPISVKASIGEQQVLKPRVIVYPVKNYSDEYEVEGKDGIQVTVERTVTIGDSSWKTYTHTADSYLPTPEKWYRVFEAEQEE